MASPARLTYPLDRKLLLIILSLLSVWLRNRGVADSQWVARVGDEHLLTLQSSMIHHIIGSRGIKLPCSRTKTLYHDKWARDGGELN